MTVIFADIESSYERNLTAPLTAREQAEINMKGRARERGAAFD